MNGNVTKNIVKGAFVLTFSSIAGKILSALYRIPLQNLTGDVGFYVYQQIYPFLGMAAVLALYAFPSSIAKIAADWKEQGREVGWTSFIFPVWTVLMLIFVSLTLLLFLLSEPLAKAVGDPQLASSYQWTAFIFLCIPFVALWRGIFQGNMEMVPIALSQVTEQLVRVFIIIFVAVFVYFQVIPIYDIGKFAAIASLFGFIAAFILLTGFLYKNKTFSAKKYAIPWKTFIRTIFLLGFAAGLNHMALLAVQLADTFTFVPQLAEFGMGELEAMERKGIFDRGQPLIQFGTVLASSLALTIIPALSNGNGESFKSYVATAIRLCLYVSAGATVGLILIFPETNLLLFQDDKGTGDLQILVVAIFFCSLSITASSILQGMGFMKRTAFLIGLVFMLKMLLNKLFIPHFGVTGASFATVLSVVVWFFAVWRMLKKELAPAVFLHKKQVAALIAATGGMGFYLSVMKFFAPFFTDSRWMLLLFVLFLVISGALLFFLMLIRFGAFSKAELKLLPFAKYLAKL